MRRQVDHCVDGGAHGLMVLGLITEAAKLGPAERLALVGIVAEANQGRPTLIRAGANGLIPAPDCLQLQRRIYDGLRSDNDGCIAAALDLHRRTLPMIVFMMRTIGGALCYGKRLVARRLGLTEVFDREPVAVRPTPSGLAELDRFAAELDALEADRPA